MSRPLGAISAVLARVERGVSLSTDDAVTLLRAKGEGFRRLLAAASSCRDRGLAQAKRTGVITYSRKVFIPLTTLCRDRCHYCTFVDTPRQLARKGASLYMSPDRVLAVARQGRLLGCKEALLTLGDRPEARWPQARAWLEQHGYASTLEYVGAMARLIRAETGLLPHLNPGVMSSAELAMLRPTAPSMGVMLETTSLRLFIEPGAVHYGSPDKDPAVRLRLLDDAGLARVPFTTGILVGIGEALQDRAESIVAIRSAHERHGHVQEVIVQNFRAKPQTAMRDTPDASFLDYVTTVAVARLVLGPNIRVQVPPNLQRPEELELLVKAGADDWGGVSPLTADHVNPERPWPQIVDLESQTAALGFTLRERLTVHPEYITDSWLDPGVQTDVDALVDSRTGLARVGADGSVFRPRKQPAIQETEVKASTGREPRSLIGRAAQDPSSLDDVEWASLLIATGSALRELVHVADDVRRYTVGEAVTFVANRNVSSCRFRDRPSNTGEAYGLALLRDITHDAWGLGLTEICVQGVLSPAEKPERYLQIVETIKAARPSLHVHAYGPRDLADFCRRAGLDVQTALAAMRKAGVDSLPGTGVKVLSERVRRVVAPEDISVQSWLELIRVAHRAGVRSSSVLFYGHVETAAERVSHLRQLAATQQSTGGFTEFVPMPLPGWGIPLVDTRSPLDEHRAMIAVSRLFFAGQIAHIQVPWTRHGLAVTAELLKAGADDLGGTLLDGRVGAALGAEAGLELPLNVAHTLTDPLLRPLRQRTTLYGEPRKNVDRDD